MSFHTAEPKYEHTLILPAVSKLGKFLFGESGNWDLFSKSSLLWGCKENKKLSLATHPPFFSDYDEIAGSEWCKRGLQPTLGTLHKKMDPPPPAFY